MKAILGMLLVCGLALSLINAVVFGVDDRQTFVAPPESVVEGFMRAVVAGRYSRAFPYLSEKLASQTDEGKLRAIGEEMKTGKRQILNVRGEQVSIAGETAQAAAIVETGGDARRLQLQLVFENGAWSINAVDSAKQPQISTDSH